MRSLIIYKDTNYQELPIMRNQRYQDQEIIIKGQQLYINNQEILPYEKCVSDVGEVLYLDDQTQQYERPKMLFIGNKDADINIPDMQGRIVIANQDIQIFEASDMYINGQKSNLGKMSIESGDILQIHAVRIEIQDTNICVNGKENTYNTSLKRIPKKESYFEGFPLYRRSPRIIKKTDEEKVEIIAPPMEESMNAKGILATFAPTILTVSVSVGVGLMMGRGAMLAMTVAGSAVSLCTNASKYISDKKETKLKNKKRIEFYKNYLLTTRRKIYSRMKHNIHVLEFNYPNIETLQDMIQNYDSRLYERTYQDEDFLEIGIGYYDGESLFKIDNKHDVMDMKKDPLKDEAKALEEEYQEMKNIPLHIDLKKGHLGLVGEKNIIHQQLQAYLMELTFFHSYHDLEIVYLYHSRDKDTFSYTKWYPHMHIKAMNVATNIHNERMRDQIMGSIYQILKERQNKVEEKQKEMNFLPHLLFIIDEPSLVLNHSIMEFLQQPVNELGYSIIYTTDKQAKLPENIKTVISYEDSLQGKLIINEGEYLNQAFHLLKTQTIDFEYNARLLAGLIHEEKMSSQIPNGVGFLSMYEVEKVEELPIQNLWNENLIYKTMAVPLGLRAKDDIVYLDLHEKAHGPHGLVAGTTGSGKSEIVQSYILSLAINFHPHDVGFLLIDYKGGGMANLFKDLPHLLGTITNLDGSESMRALISIQSELKRRQRVFEHAGVNNINSYTKLFKKGEVTEPLPHLFIISDEFAELKKEQPEFMKELVSTARVGRSLGVHLILATQKPSGVVDDQIWSNSKFKLCLKVQNEADSKEMLKTPDAANITQPGRSYLQVGNNEIYELFQSAYSGASYIKKEEDNSIDDRVYLLNELGQGQVINQDLSANKSEEGVQITELDKIVEHIHDLYESLHAVEVTKPWLPALPTNVILPECKRSDEIDLSCPIGLIDIPEKQQQVSYVLDIQKEGNIVYMASSGYGKTVFLSTIMMALAKKNSVENLNFYILDFGNSALIPFNSLYHTAEYITFDDEERFDKFLTLIQDEIKQRKQIIAEHQTQNFSVHNRTTEEKLKAIVVIIDQFDAIKEKGLDTEMLFSKLVRDGASLGIYIILSGSRSGDIRYATMNQIKVKIAGFLFDESEARQLVGRSNWTLPDSKGRMLVKSDDVHLGQMYMPVDSKNEIEYIDNLRQAIKDINQMNEGSKAKRIAVLPENLYYRDIFDYDWDTKETYALGLDKESVLIQGFTFKSEPFLIIGPPRTGKTNMLKVMIAQTKGPKYIFDTSKMNLNYIRQETNVTYAFEESGYVEVVNTIKEMIEERKVQFNEAYAKDQQLIPGEFYRQLESCTCFIDDVDYFHETIKMKEPKIDGVLTQAIECGIHIVVGGDSTKMNTLNNSAGVFKRTGAGIVLGSCMMVNPFNITMQETPKIVGDGILFNEYGKHVIKVTKFEE